MVRADTTPHLKLDVAGSSLEKFLQGPSLGIEEYLCLELDISLLGEDFYIGIIICFLIYLL